MDLVKSIIRMILCIKESPTWVYFMVGVGLHLQMVIFTRVIGSMAKHMERECLSIRRGICMLESGKMIDIMAEARSIGIITWKSMLAISLMAREQDMGPFFTRIMINMTVNGPKVNVMALVIITMR